MSTGTSHITACPCVDLHVRMYSLRVGYVGLLCTCRTNNRSLNRSSTQMCRPKLIVTRLICMHNMKNSTTRLGTGCFFAHFALRSYAPAVQVILCAYATYKRIWLLGRHTLCSMQITDLLTAQRYVRGHS